MRDVLVRYISHELLNEPEVRQGLEEVDLLMSGMVDSLGVTSLIFFIEQEFGVEIPPEDVTIENFQSVLAIEAYLRRRES